MAERVMAILADAKRLAQEYRELTGKPLGITGEVAEFEAGEDSRGWSSHLVAKPATPQSKT